MLPALLIGNKTAFKHHAIDRHPLVTRDIISSFDRPMTLPAFRHSQLYVATVDI